MKKKIDDLLNSNYDGIQEYDNDLPRWWVALFGLTVLFGLIYIFLFHGVSSKSSEELLAEQMAAINAAKAAHAQKAPASMVNLKDVVNDSARIANGKLAFTGKCAPCHGAEGQGVVGPNLTDQYWIHGGSLEEIKRSIEEGVPEKGMLAWKALMTPSEVDDVVAFIFSIRGTNPSNPKAPQGDLVE